ncbi:hypothetical protein [Serratia aquatilis]|uniref:Uncharacterized protein n=1 Tax=Serratia aquatilis TaxID=1737515 RepID=A0ABV6EFA9_9GAMM
MPRRTAADSVWCLAASLGQEWDGFGMAAGTCSDSRQPEYTLADR